MRKLNIDLKNLSTGQMRSTSAAPKLVTTSAEEVRAEGCPKEMYPYLVEGRPCYRSPMMAPPSRS